MTGAPLLFQALSTHVLAGPIVGPRAGADPVAEGGYWTTEQLLIGIGLPVLVIGLGIGLLIWGRREHAEAEHHHIVRAGFGGPPGTSDHSPTLDLGEPASSADRRAGRGKRQAGVAAIAIGAVWILVAAAVRIIGG